MWDPVCVIWIYQADTAAHGRLWVWSLVSLCSSISKYERRYERHISTKPFPWHSHKVEKDLKRVYLSRVPTCETHLALWKIQCQQNGDDLRQSFLTHPWDWWNWVPKKGSEAYLGGCRGYGWRQRQCEQPLFDPNLTAAESPLTIAYSKREGANSGPVALLQQSWMGVPLWQCSFLPSPAHQGRAASPLALCLQQCAISVGTPSSLAHNSH